MSTMFEKIRETYSDLICQDVVDFIPVPSAIQAGFIRLKHDDVVRAGDMIGSAFCGIEALKLKSSHIFEEEDAIVSLKRRSCDVSAPIWRPPLFKLSEQLPGNQIFSKELTLP